jgi:hypothetical protein
VIYADAALKRAARFASGWWPFLTLPEKIDYTQWVIEEIKPKVAT